MAENGFDFLNKLSASDTELPSITRAGGGNGKGRQVENNPFVQWLQESYNDGVSFIGKSVTVPARHALKTEYLIRQAGEDLSIGVRVVRMVDGERINERKAIKELNGNKNVQILFQAQKKRKYAPRNRRSASDAVEE
jgi:hypothetical protein